MDLLKQQVIDAGRELCRSGLIARTWGNVSVRTDDNHFAVTASGKAYDTLTEDEIITLNLKDLSYEGDVKPSGEKKVHRVIYKMRADAGFIIHTHQTNASAVAAMGLKEIKFAKKYPGIGFDVPCAEYGLPGSKAVVSGVAKVLKRHETRAILMSNHGAVCFGRDRDEAFEAAYALEEACGDFLQNTGVVMNSSGDWKEDRLGVYLDDFAQMFGTHLSMKNYDPQTVAAQYGEDVEAVRMVVDKNCLAGLAAKMTGSKPIRTWECLYMRMIYKKKYSLLKGVDR